MHAVLLSHLAVLKKHSLIIRFSEPHLQFSMASRLIWIHHQVSSFSLIVLRPWNLKFLIVWISWLCYFSPIYYAFQAIAILMDFPEVLRDTNSKNDSFFYVAIGALIGFIFVFRIMQFFLLHYFSNSIKN